MSAPPALRVAVLGATGLVGQELIRLLESRSFPVAELIPLASERSQSRHVRFRGESLPMQLASPAALARADLVLASAGGDVSRALLPGAAAAGAVCVDNTSAFRLQPGVPLVVPEVNGHRLDDIAFDGRGAIVANPNCSTIQLVVALKPIHDEAGLERVVVSTYQSVSGAGREALSAFRGATAALMNQGEAPEPLPEPLRGTAAFDTLPTIGELDADGHSSEELKMVHETPAILEAEVAVDACCVRVPVFTGHAESVLVETSRPLSLARAREVLAAAPGVALAEPDELPTPRAVAGGDAVHVGRLRSSRGASNGLMFWVVADNLLRGAALNAVLIAESIAARAPVHSVA